MKEALASWHALSEPIERATGWQCTLWAPSKLDPTKVRSEGFVQMPAHFAKALVKALQENETKRSSTRPGQTSNQKVDMASSKRCISVSSK